MSFPILFTYAFRIFFLLGGLGAVLLIPVWVLMLGGHLDMPGYTGSASWHGHELVFGYAPAVITGFLLTAAYNWTGTPNVKGAPLVALALIWLAG
ncbi:MAG: short-chain dehydrogenase, partial [Alphaproteobacteria bacterium]|nr:short-chain dehydrogenase [Alphaproteobacteria bacterium]